MTMKQLFYLITILLLSASFSANSQTGNYIIATTIQDTTDDWFEPVRILRDYRNAQVVTFETNLIDFLIPQMITREARYVAVVLRPEELDVNLVRRFLVMSTMIDDDPFSDFSYGYITGATAQDAVDFVNKIIQAEEQIIELYPLHVSGFAASSLNFIYNSPGDYMHYLNPASYSQMYLETNDNGAGNIYFNENKEMFSGKKVMDIGHNGDPHMIWLFEGGNMDPDPPVWDYDPDKIEDPLYARQGISSYDIADMSLYPAVVFNGACHAAITKNALVEGDIAATFGDTEGQVRFYTLSDEFSFALSLLKTGITGYFAACGSNNANDQSEEVYNAFLFNEPLGDIHKRSVDGVVMGFLGNRPALKYFSEGESTYGCDVLSSGSFDPSEWSGACYMLGGKANRIYFGCPLFNPLQNHSAPELEITKAEIALLSSNSLTIDVIYDKPDASEAYFPVWDKFHHGNTRIYIPVEMPEYCDEILSVSVLEASSDYDLVFYAIENFHGKLILHIEIAIPDDMYDAIDFEIGFLINFNGSVLSSSEQITTTVVFPNPARDRINLCFGDINPVNCNIRLYDINGRLVLTENISNSSKINLDVSYIAGGTYILEVIQPDKSVSNHKIIIDR
jgi:hypothetical protein